MAAENWFSTSEFETLWKTAFSDAKSAFPGLPKDVKPRQKREKGGALWTEIHKPSPGIQLLAIEFQTEVYPLSIRLKVWIDQCFPELYTSLRSAKTPDIAGQKTVLFPDEELRPSWKNQLKAKDITLFGLNYKVSDLSFLHDVETAESKLQKMGTNFSSGCLTELSLPKPPHPTANLRTKHHQRAIAKLHSSDQAIALMLTTACIRLDQRAAETRRQRPPHCCR